MLRAIRCVLHAFAIGLFVAGLGAHAATTLADSTSAFADAQIAPSPLLAIDQNRASVVERIVAEWGDALLRSKAGVDAAQLRSMLAGMRADHLLAASLAGTLDGLRNALSIAVTSDAGVKPSLLQAKALGDTSGDLVYTPITPCRIVDTVTVGGPITALTTRSFFGTTGTNFLGQGGSATNCAIPLNATGLQATVTVVSPPQNGYLLVYPYGAPQPTAFTMIYQANTIASTAVTIPLTKGQASEFTAFLERTAFLQVDVVGYFKAPSGGFVTSVTAGTGLTGGTITGSGTLAVDTAVVQARVTGTCAAGSSIRVINANGTVTCEADDTGGVGGTVTSVGTGTGLTGGPITTIGTINLAATNLLPAVACASGQIPKWSGSAWVCAADNSGAANAFVQNGNAFKATAVLGTNDNFPIDVVANSQRALRISPNAISPNLIGGHPVNIITGDTEYAGQTIGGGGRSGIGCYDPVTATDIGECLNATANDFAVVGGGLGNRASGYGSTVGGGEGNTASGYYSTVGGGIGNRTSASDSTIGGGLLNTASGLYSTVAGGLKHIATGRSSTVGGGEENTASGNYSFAAGTRAKANHHFSFVWSGSDAADTSSQIEGDFVVNAPGGIRMFGTAGSCVLTNGASGWSCSSDRALKSDIEAVDGQAVLRRVVDLPIAHWSFASVPGVAHMGPMAQDFHAAFGLGDDATRLAPMDVQGVALAAIQGLHAKLEAALAAKDMEIAALRRELADLRATRETELTESGATQAQELAELRRAVEVLMARTAPSGQLAQAR